MSIIARDRVNTERLELSAKINELIDYTRSPQYALTVRRNRVHANAINNQLNAMRAYEDALYIRIACLDEEGAARG